jgi:hypothetical protein
LLNIKKAKVISQGFYENEMELTMTKLLLFVFTIIALHHIIHSSDNSSNPKLDITRAFFKAIQADDYALVCQYLNDKSDSLSVLDCDTQKSFLGAAVQTGNGAMVNCILEILSNKNFGKKNIHKLLRCSAGDGHNAMNVAMQQGNYYVVKRISEFWDYHYYSPLRIAAQQGNLLALQAYLSNAPESYYPMHATLNKKQRVGLKKQRVGLVESLFDAVKSDDSLAIKTLVSAGVCVDSFEPTGETNRFCYRTPLFVAVLANKPNAVQTLLDLGADAEHNPGFCYCRFSVSNETLPLDELYAPLEIAQKRQFREIVKILQKALYEKRTEVCWLYAMACRIIGR